MANIFGRIFGYQKRKPNISPVGLKGYTDTATGGALNQRILAALNQGQNIGFGEDYVNRSTSPAVAQLRADLPNQIRDIQGYYSGMGLGRSTPAAQQQGEFRAQHARDINQLLADAYMQNELQKKTDIGRYENLANTVAGQDLASENAKLADIEGAKRANYDASIARDTANTGAINRILAAAGGGLKPFLEQPDMGGGGISQYGNVYGSNTPYGATDTGTYSTLPGFKASASPSGYLQKIFSIISKLGGA